eukprot:g6958.t1
MDRAWQVIVIQTRGRQVETDKAQTNPWSRLVSAKEEFPLQITISYGDDKVSTPLVKASQPLWNFWTQLADKGGSEELLFSLVQRDVTSGSFSVEGEVRVDLSKFRQDGQSVELWEKLQPIATETETGAEKAAARSEGTAAELHLLITYCPTNQSKSDTEAKEDKDADCLPCSAATIGMCSMELAQGCVIS